MISNRLNEAIWATHFKWKKVVCEDQLDEGVINRRHTTDTPYSAIDEPAQIGLQPCLFRRIAEAGRRQVRCP